MDAVEIFALVGFPPRVAGRLPLILRYITGARANILAPSTYAIERWGPSARFRPWLLLDSKNLESLERLLNEGTDDEVMEYRRTQLSNGAGTAVVGSLLASACATMLTLDSLSKMNLTVCAVFTISLMLSMLCVFFTIIQQLEFSSPTTANMLRLWFWNGRTRAPPLRHSSGSPVVTLNSMLRESSVTSLYVLTAPFEILTIAVTIFLSGVIAYLTLAMRNDLNLGTGPSWGNRGLLIAFVVCTAFPLLMYGQALGQKDNELAKARAAERHAVHERSIDAVLSVRVPKH